MKCSFDIDYLLKWESFIYIEPISKTDIAKISSVNFISVIFLIHMYRYEKEKRGKYEKKAASL